MGMQTTKLECMSGTKVCVSCKRELSFELFYPRSDGHGDGYFRACAECERAKGRAKYERRREHERKRHAEKWLRLKREVIGHYGGRCTCCGETELVFLALDHINGGGNAHRKSVGAGNFYSWVKQNGYPDGLQVHCHNCNWAKTHGGCPHQLAQSAEAA